MFNPGEILVNKKNEARVLLIKDKEGTATILRSTNKDLIGKEVKCTNPAFYRVHENPEQFLKEKIINLYRKNKKIKIENYL